LTVPFFKLSFDEDVFKKRKKERNEFFLDDDFFRKNQKTKKKKPNFLFFEKNTKRNFEKYHEETKSKKKNSFFFLNLFIKPKNKLAESHTHTKKMVHTILFFEGAPDLERGFEILCIAKNDNTSLALPIHSCH